MYYKTITDFIKEGDKELQAIIIIGKGEITVDIVNGLKFLPSRAKKIGIRAFKAKIKPSSILAIVQYYNSHKLIHPSFSNVLEEIS